MGNRVLARSPSRDPSTAGSKLRREPITWQHIPEGLLSRADANLALMAEAELENVSIVVVAAKRHSEVLPLHRRSPIKPGPD